MHLFESSERGEDNPVVFLLRYREATRRGAMHLFDSLSEEKKAPLVSSSITLSDSSLNV
jgi:hypothetical protein